VATLDAGAILNQSTLGSEVLRLQSTATNDDPEFVIKQSRVVTTTDTPTTLFTLAVPTDKVVSVLARVVGRQTEAGAGLGYGISILCYGFVKNISGTVTSSMSQIVPISDIGGAAVTFVVSGTDVLFKVTGYLNTDIVWHGNFEIQSIGT
jgi:hypothetical protein